MTMFAQAQHGGHYKSATRRIAGQSNLLSRDAAFAEPKERRSRVVQRRGKRMLGSQTVVQGENAIPRQSRQRCSDGTMRLRRAADIAASMKIEQDTIGDGALGHQPLSTHGHVHPLDRDVTGIHEAQTIGDAEDTAGASPRRGQLLLLSTLYYKHYREAGHSPAPARPYSTVY